MYNNTKNDSESENANSTKLSSRAEQIARSMQCILKNKVKLKPFEVESKPARSYRC